MVEKSPFRIFILETNGILLGADHEYARQIARFKKIHTRVGERSAKHILKRTPPTGDDGVGGATCQIERGIGSGWWLRGKRAG